jgi:LCP family protein required for cell wall assembly
LKNTAFTDKNLQPAPAPDQPGKRRRGLPPWLGYPILGALLAVLALASGPFLRVWTGGTLFGQRIVRPPFAGRTEFNVLVLGLDQPDKLFPNKGRRSDTMLLAHVDLVTKTVTGVSIPRDTRVKLTERGPWTKINAAYTEGGVQGASDIVTGITGVMPDYYVVVDTASTKHLVDLVGGVVVTVDKRMKYNDNWQDLHIDLQPGRQTLDGDQAVGYVRFRHDATGDIARMKRQQMFIAALARRLVAPANLPKLPWIVAELRRQVDTNMRDDDLLFLAREMKDIPSSHLAFQSLDGESRTIRGISYFLPYREKMNERILEAFPSAMLPGDPPIDTVG